MPPAPVAPKIDFQPCGDSVCMTIDEAKSLVQYKHDVDDLNAALARCSLVQVTK